MADEKALQANQAQVANLIAQLQAQAGPRGATYAGRVITPQDTPQSIMGRLPQGDTEEYGTMGLLGPGLGGLGAGITKAQLKAGLRPIEAELGAIEGTPVRQAARQGAQRVSKAELQAGVRPAAQIARIAKPGSAPVSPPHKMLPAWINETSGEVRHSMEAIPAGWHEPNTPKIFDSRYKMLVPDPNWTRGHVDPVTFDAFTDKMLDAASRKFGLWFTR